MDKRVQWPFSLIQKAKEKKNLPSNGKETAIKMQFSIQGPSRQSHIKYTTWRILRVCNSRRKYGIFMRLFTAIKSRRSEEIIIKMELFLLSSNSVSNSRSVLTLRTELLCVYWKKKKNEKFLNVNRQQPTVSKPKWCITSMVDFGFEYIFFVLGVRREEFHSHKSQLVALLSLKSHRRDRQFKINFIHFSCPFIL